MRMQPSAAAERDLPDMISTWVPAARVRGYSDSDEAYRERIRKEYYGIRHAVEDKR